LDIGDRLNNAGFRFNDPASLARDTYLVRADHRLSDTMTLFFRLMGVREDATDIVNSGAPRFPGDLPGVIRPRVNAFSLGSTWTLSPKAVNDLRVGRSRLALAITRPDRVAGPMITASAWIDPLNPQFPQSTSTAGVTLTDHLSYASRNHIFKTGIDFRFLFVARDTSEGVYPNVSLNADNGNNPPVGIGPTGPFAQSFGTFYDHLLGRISAVQQTFYSDLNRYNPAGSGLIRNYRGHEYHAFFQDDWKLRRNLTLNLGLRYEFDGVPYERDGLEGCGPQIICPTLIQ
jgi:outer membrane receptor protein involved in Fe transport